MFSAPADPALLYSTRPGWVTTVPGLADDHRAANPQRAGRDSYELFLGDLLGSQLGREHADDYAVSFHTVAGQDVCRLRGRPPRRST